MSTEATVTMPRHTPRLLIQIRNGLEVLFGSRTAMSGLSIVLAWVFIASLVVWYVLKLTIGIRVSEEAEYEGVDASECGIEAYPEFVASVK